MASQGGEMEGRGGREGGRERQAGQRVTLHLLIAKDVPQKIAMPPEK